MSDFVNTVDIVGDEALTGSIVDRSITTIVDNTITEIGEYAFTKCSALTEAVFPLVTNIGVSGFGNCTALTTLNLPLLTSCGRECFAFCGSLTTINLPKLKSAPYYGFRNCYGTVTADFPSLTTIDGYAFNSCCRLTALILRSETMCTLYNTNAFDECYHILGTVNSTYNPDGLADGYIYVPRALVDSYKADSKWSTYASQFRALEDYTVDGTITGALDEGKI